MKAYIEARVIEIAKYTIENKSTVRNTAKEFGIGKTTVFHDLTFRLPQINPALYRQVTGILGENLAERHIRGGAATKLKYAEI